MFFFYSSACHKQVTPIETELRHNFSLILYCLCGYSKLLNQSYQQFSYAWIFLNIHLCYIDSCGYSEMFHVSYLTHLRFWNICQIFLNRYMPNSIKRKNLPENLRNTRCMLQRKQRRILKSQLHAGLYWWPWSATNSGTFIE